MFLMRKRGHLQLNKYLLARTADETLKGSIAWDPWKHLPFDVPFSDAKVQIELGLYFFL
jgi:hypothetical protein